MISGISCIHETSFPLRRRSVEAGFFAARRGSADWRCFFVFPCFPFEAETVVELEPPGAYEILAIL